MLWVGKAKNLICIDTIYGLTYDNEFDLSKIPCYSKEVRRIAAYFFRKRR